MGSRLPRTAVIGAGISGLTASKMLADYGVPYTTFESSDRVGGNWAFGNPNGHSSAYRSLHIDTSKLQLSFKDFPMPQSYPDFPHHTDIKRYLDDYTDAFGLREHIEFRNGITHARRLSGRGEMSGRAQRGEMSAGGWELTTEQGQTRYVDLLVVANGHHWDPRYPDFPGEFAGIEMHAHHYIDIATPHDFTGKRILVVGLGNSAADIAVELSSKALRNTLTLSTRSGAWIVPKYFGGKPADRFYHTSPYIPFAWQRKFMQVMQPLSAGRPEDYGLPTPNHKFFEAHPTQSVELPLRLGSGDIIPKPDVARFDGDTVHFADGSSGDFDIVIYATGYNITFPFFDPDFLSAPDNKIDLYKRMFAPGLDDLVFIGFAQATPTLFPFVECQARLLGAYAVGRYRLPPVDQMHRVIAADTEFYTGHMVPSARHTQQLDYYLYEHDLRTKELPAGRRRAATQGPPSWASAADDGRTALQEAR
ncbi:MAG: NAD(P)-binding domain-containing protein [Gordonia sp. (in: high G+C Gram-positive bacteria)]